MSLALHLEAVWMPSESAVPCGLIVHELVATALTYAFPPGRAGEVAMTLHAEAEGRVSLVVRDTGVGMPDGFDSDQPRALGWPLVRLLTAPLGGTLTLERHRGMRVTLTWALPQAPTAAD